MSNIFIIDDDPNICNALAAIAKRMGHEATYSLMLKEGLKEISTKNYDVVFLDVRLPDGNGLKALPEIMGAPSSPEVIIITGEGDRDGADLAIKSGAWDYIEKPASMEAMVLPLMRALQYRDDLRKARKPATILNLGGIIGTSPQMRSCLDALAQAASSDVNTLISGETGTGKELFAKTIHRNSSRAERHLVVVDCATLPENLVESILFGHKKGAFTGADKESAGLIMGAHEGTLFLDEVGELPLKVQKAFLRVLQERRFMPLGGNQEKESNFRLLAATNKDLEEMTQKRHFREDLFFRLKSLTIEIPPLRERQQDIKDLIMHYLVKVCERLGTETKGISPEFLEAMVLYGWPGNVRELVNVLEMVIVKARFDPTLYTRHLPHNVHIHAVQTSLNKAKIEPVTDKEDDSSSPMLPGLQKVRENALLKVEKQYLQELMSLTKGNIKEACRISGLSRSRLYGIMQKHNISKTF